MALLEKHSRASEDQYAELSAAEISALIVRAQDQDEEAFASLLRIFQARLHRQAFFLAGEEHQALDLLQETMFETWKHLGRYDSRASFFTWMCSIMIHRHYDWLRRLRTRASFLFTTPLDESLPETAPNPDEALLDADHARLVRECLDALPARQRTIVYLRFYAGESLEGISVIVHCSVGTVKSRLFHALRRLAKMHKLQQLRNDS